MQLPIRTGLCLTLALLDVLPCALAAPQTVILVVLCCHDVVMRTPRTHFPTDFAGLTIGVNTGSSRR